MGKEIIKFGNNEAERHKCYQHKDPISIHNVKIDGIVVFSKFPFGKKDFKCFISYKDDRNVRPLSIILPNMSAYKNFLIKLNIYAFL